VREEWHRKRVDGLRKKLQESKPETAGRIGKRGI
jgi:hypothetical protein